MEAHPYSALRAIQERFNLPDPVANFNGFLDGVLRNTSRRGPLTVNFCVFPNDISGIFLFLYIFIIIFYFLFFINFSFFIYFTIKH